MDPVENYGGRSQMTLTILDQVRRLASDLFGVPVNRIMAESSPETIEAWDSTQHLNFVLALEEKYGLQLSPEEMEQMRNVGEAAKLVESKQQRAPR
jgi:acyl carrier protein